MYVIKSVVSKRVDKVNQWHHCITGKRCLIEILKPGEVGYLQIEGVAHNCRFTRYHTSVVLDIRNCDGILTIETVNSVYTLQEYVYLRG